QDFCELIVEDSWLNQLDDVIVGHGISLLRWRSGGVKHPHDMPPSRFPPSPTLGDSSHTLGWQLSCRQSCERLARIFRSFLSRRGISRPYDVSPQPETMGIRRTQPCWIL